MLNPWDLSADQRARLEESTKGAKWLWLDPVEGRASLTTPTLRTAAQAAGVHLFTRGDCNVWANGPFLSLHACQDGDVEIDTGRPGTVIDVMDGQALGHGPKLTLPMKRGETRVLRMK